MSMSTSEDHLFWAKRQMEEANTPVGVRVAAEKILETFFETVVSVPQGEEVLAVVTRLARGHSLEPHPAEGDNNIQWEEVRRGRIFVQDVVRVKHNAYGGYTGTIHNGRVGRVVALRNGEIFISYSDNREPSFDTIRHSPNSLEKMVPLR